MSGPGPHEISPDSTAALQAELAALRAQVEQLGRESARLRNEAAHRALLNDASVLLTDSLDYGVTLAAVARLVVPRLCDWCTIYALDGDGESYRMVEALHADPAQSMLLRKARQRVDPDYYQVSPVWQRLRGGESLLHSEVHEQDLRTLAKDETWFRLLRDVLRCRSWMLVPLRCRDRMLGTLGLAMGPSGRRYGPEDLTLAEELARRVALALDNARLYQQAQDALRAREEFLSIASHEMRTPLTTLLLQVELLQRFSDGGLSMERTAALIEGMDRQTRRLTRLMKNLFDISRIHAGTLDLHLEPVDLVEVCREVVCRADLDAQRAGAPLSSRLPGAPIVGHWDRLRLDQVVTNLVGNAIKYGAGAPIEVAVVAPGPGRAQVAVQDGGPGIDPAQQERIFDRFARATRERQEGSLGLGLYIVKRIVAALGGTVHLHSEPGRGATFVVDLPLGGPTSG